MRSQYGLEKLHIWNNLMKLSSLIKKCETVTCNKGWIQATDKGVAFIEYLGPAAKLTFAVDAKAFIDALKALGDDCRIVKENDIIILFNDEQAINLQQQVAEIEIPRPDGFWEVGDVAWEWSKINQFITPAYPAVRCTSDYFEVLSSTTIVRLKVKYGPKEDTKIVLSYKIPKGSQAYKYDSLFFWISYGGGCYIALGYITPRLPNTDVFFNGDEENSLIPTKLVEQLVPAETAEFHKSNLHLRTKHIADAVIENIPGNGKYEYGMFAKAVRNGIAWSFTSRTLNITGPDIKIILEDISNA